MANPAISESRFGKQILSSRFDPDLSIRGTNGDQAAEFHTFAVRRGGIRVARVVGPVGSATSIDGLIRGRRVINPFDVPTAVAMKHGVPAELVQDDDPTRALALLLRPRRRNSEASFVVTNRVIGVGEANVLVKALKNGMVLDGIAAPYILEDARDTLIRDYAKLQGYEFSGSDSGEPERRVYQEGAMVIQNPQQSVPFERWKQIYGDVPGDRLRKNLFMAAQMARFVPSNAVVAVGACEPVSLAAVTDSNREDAMLFLAMKLNAQQNDQLFIMAHDANVSGRQLRNVIDEFGGNLQAIVHPGNPTPSDALLLDLVSRHDIALFETGQRNLK